MRRFILFSAILAGFATPVAAQIGLPLSQVPVVGPLLDRATDTLESTVRETQRMVERLADDRLSKIDRLVRSNRDIIERDAQGAPARRGELLAMDAIPSELAAAQGAGFSEISREQIEGLGITVVRLRVPGGMDLAEAETKLVALMPEAEISADNLHFQSGEAGGVPLLAAASASVRSDADVGMIDGATGAAVKVAETRGFAEGAPYPSNHGSAVASLLIHAGAGTVRVADVYGTDKAGGNALAMARGLGWLVARGSKVVTISLVGPRNSVLERAIGAAQREGVVVVAAVGNDGPAAPPAYPASYPGVVAVTAVDGKRRALIEAGRALHLDYAAPGAGISGISAKGKRIRLRGTSYATPLVAARVAVAVGARRNWRSALDAEAIDLGKKGPDATYGRGLVCANCTGR